MSDATEDKPDVEAQLAEMKAKLDEFRENNVQLMKSQKEKDEELARYRREAEERAAAAAQKEREALAATKDADEVRAAMEAKIAELNAANEQKVSGLSAQLESLLVDQAARQALEANEFHVELGLPHVKARTRLVERNGQKRAVVFDGDSPVLNDDGSEQTVGQFVKAMAERDEYKPLRRSTAAATSGGSPERGAGGASVKSKAELKSRKAKSDFIDAHGLEAFAALPVE